jgi:serine/threonine-protein kinase
MARVYIAFARGPAGFDKLVVVKQVRPELAWDHDFITMFFDEARIAARLQHPNVIHTYEVVEDAGQYILVMEYLEGHTLASVLKKVSRALMPLEDHLWILTQVLAGLQYAHELRDYDGTPLGLVHRDVSPSNVFITYNGEVKLLDFGIAKAAGAISATHKGTIKGKLGYGAPEQLVGDPVDARGDIFSTGVMLWEALARQRRKLADTPAAILQARIYGVEPKIRQVVSDVPTVLADICDKAMEADPRLRYATAAEFQHDLEHYLERSPRRVGGREMAALLRRAFGEERLESRKKLEERLQGAVSTPPEASLWQTRSAAPGPSSDVPVHDPSARATTPDFRRGAWLQSPKWMPALGAVALAGAAILLVRAKRSGGGGNEIPPSHAATPLAPPSAAPAASRAEDTKPADSDLVEVAIRAQPSAATLTFDGQPLAGNPFHARLPKDARTHVLRAAAPGFLAIERVVSLSADLHLDLLLKPAPLPASRRGVARSEPREPALEPPPAPKRVDAPGMDLGRPSNQRSTRDIDDKDPYGP